MAKTGLNLYYTAELTHYLIKKNYSKERSCTMSYNIYTLFTPFTVNKWFTKWTRQSIKTLRKWMTSWSFGFNVYSYMKTERHRVDLQNTGLEVLFLISFWADATQFNHLLVHNLSMSFNIWMLSEHPLLKTKFFFLNHVPYPLFTNSLSNTYSLLLPTMQLVLKSQSELHRQRLRENGRFQAPVLSEVSYSKNLTIVIQTSAVDCKEHGVQDWDRSGHETRTFVIVSNLTIA